jgi:hypothetical protein
LLSKEEKFESDLKKVLLSPSQKLSQEFKDWRNKAKGKDRIHQF